MGPECVRAMSRCKSQAYHNFVTKQGYVTLFLNTTVECANPPAPLWPRPAAPAPLCFRPPAPLPLCPARGASAPLPCPQSRHPAAPARTGGSDSSALGAARCRPGPRGLDHVGHRAGAPRPKACDAAAVDSLQTPLVGIERKQYCIYCFFNNFNIFNSCSKVGQPPHVLRRGVSNCLNTMFFSNKIQLLTHFERRPADASIVAPVQAGLHPASRQPDLRLSL